MGRCSEPQRVCVPYPGVSRPAGGVRVPGHVPQQPGQDQGVRQGASRRGQHEPAHGGEVCTADMEERCVALCTADMDEFKK